MEFVYKDSGDGDESKDDRDQEMDKGNKYKEDENNEIAYSDDYDGKLFQGFEDEYYHFPDSIPDPKDNFVKLLRETELDFIAICDKPETLLRSLISVSIVGPRD